MNQSKTTDNRGSQLIATSLTTAILAICAVGIRIWSRKRSKAGLWWDDWTIFASLVGYNTFLGTFKCGIGQVG